MLFDTILMALCALVIAVFVTGLMRKVALSRGLLDVPNDRSSHTVPTPRGGGVSIVIAVNLILVFMASTNTLQPRLFFALAGGGLAVAFIGFMDDRRAQPAGIRLAVHIASAVWAVAWLGGLTQLGAGGGVLELGWMGSVLAVLGVVWALNLFNFMDGIDGITGGQTVAIGFGAALVAFVSADPNSGALPLGLALGATALGFLAWNWAPAKLFLGDVGSVPLGFVIGWLLLSMAGDGRWAPALILPLYYLIDATITLLRRAARFERIWHAHREHFYQRAVQAGLGHGAVVLRILGCNLVLIGLAVLGLAWPWVATILAFVVVGGLLWELGRRNTAAAPLV